MRVRQALAEGASGLERLTEEEPAIVRAYFDEALLPTWAEAQLAPPGAARELAEQAAVVAGALWRRTGDALPRDAAVALQSSVAVAGRDPPNAQALGYRFLAEARRRDETQRPACESFREAHRFLSQGGSPYEAVAAERTVAKCLYPSQLAAARAELARLAAAAEPRAHLFLLARTRWLQGLIAVTQGDLTGGLDRYRLARDGFVALGDAQNQAFVHALRAEALTLLGEDRRAWEERRSALALLDRVQDPRRVQSILEDAALACLDARLPRAALDLLTALVESGLLDASPGLLSDVLTRRSAVRHALGEDQLAVRDLSEARRRLPSIEDGALSDRMRAEVDAAEGVLLASKQPERAVDALQRAAEYFASAGPVRVPPLRLQTARVESARGLVDSAEEELLAGMHLIEAQRVSLHDLALQASFFEQAVPMYDDMVALQLDQRHDPAAALAFVERGRGRQVVDSLAAAATRERPVKSDVSEASFEPGSLQRELPQGVALVYYLSLDRRLLAWLVTRDDVRFVEQPVPRAEIVRLVAAQQAALELRATLASVQRVGARLHDVLVRPLAPFPPSVRALAFVPDACAPLRVLRGLVGPGDEPLSRGGLRAGRVPEREGAGLALARFGTSAGSPCAGRRQPSRRLGPVARIRAAAGRRAGSRRGCRALSRRRSCCRWRRHEGDISRRAPPERRRPLRRARHIPGRRPGPLAPSPRRGPRATPERSTCATCRGATFVPGSLSSRPVAPRRARFRGRRARSAWAGRSSLQVCRTSSAACGTWTTR